MVARRITETGECAFGIEARDVSFTCHVVTSGVEGSDIIGSLSRYLLQDKSSTKDHMRIHAVYVYPHKSAPCAVSMHSIWKNNKGRQTS
jgi:hypothetical protein